MLLLSNVDRQIDRDKNAYRVEKDRGRNRGREREKERGKGKEIELVEETNRWTDHRMKE